MSKQTIVFIIGVIIVVIAGIVFITQSSPAPITDNYPVPQATSTGNNSAAVLTSAEVAKNNNAQSCYTIVNGNVYNLTPWINQHPGGSQAILRICGKDGTALFTAQHGTNANAQAALANFILGPLVK